MAKLSCTCPGGFCFFLRGLKRCSTVCLALLLSITILNCSTTSQNIPVTGATRLKIGPLSNTPNARVGEELAKVNETPVVPDTPPTTNPAPASITHDILTTAYSQMGKAYRFGGYSPETGFDCAGFVQWTFGQNGFKLPRTTSEQMKIGVKVAQNDLRPGDLIFYWRNRGRQSKHVGIFVGNGTLIHSPQTGESICEVDAFDRYRQSRFIEARRVVDDPNAAPLNLAHKNQVVAQALAANKTKPQKIASKKTASRKTTTASSRSKSYRIKAGDTIWSVAQRFGVSYRSLLEANALPTRHVLRVGQVISIP